MAGEELGLAEAIDRSRISLMPESPGLYLRLTVLENLQCFAGLLSWATFAGASNVRCGRSILKTAPVTCTDRCPRGCVNGSPWREHCSLEMNDTIEIPVEPGRHTLQVRNGRNSSRTQTFDATEGETVAFRCTGKRILPIFLASFVVPSLALSLRRE
jgi:hypothetical protein